MEEIRNNLKETKVLVDSHEHSEEFDLCFSIRANTTLIEWVNLKGLAKKIYDTRNMKLVAPFWKLCTECDIQLTEKEREDIFHHLIDYLHLLYKI